PLQRWPRPRLGGTTHELLQESEVERSGTLEPSRSSICRASANGLHAVARHSALPRWKWIPARRFAPSGMTGVARLMVWSTMAAGCGALGAWAVERFEAKSRLREDRFSTIPRPIVVLWAKKRRKYGPRRRLCSPDHFCRA